MTAEQLTTIRRMAASILGVGVHRVWIDPERIEDVLGAVTREDVRKLIKDGVIKAKRPRKGLVGFALGRDTGRRRGGRGRAQGAVRAAGWIVRGCGLLR